MYIKGILIPPESRSAVAVDVDPHSHGDVLALSAAGEETAQVDHFGEFSWTEKAWCGVTQALTLMGRRKQHSTITLT